MKCIFCFLFVTVVFKFEGAPQPIKKIVQQYLTDNRCIILIDGQEALRYRSATKLICDAANIAFPNQYLIVTKDLTPLESDLFLSKILHITVKASKVINDDSLYDFFCDDSGGGIVYADPKLNRIVYYNIESASMNDVSRRNINFKLIQVDSTILRDDRYPIGKFATIKNVNDSIAIVMNPNLNLLLRVNTEKGTISGVWHLNYDFDKLYRNFQSRDPSQLHYALRARAQMKKGNIQEFTMLQMNMDDSSNVYVIGMIYYPSFEVDDKVKKDTQFFLRSHYLLLKTSANLQDTHYFEPATPDSESTILKYGLFNYQDDFYAWKDTIICPIIRVRVPSNIDSCLFLCTTHRKRPSLNFVFDRDLLLHLPSFFLKSGLNYRMANLQFYKFNDSVCCQFRYIPTGVNISGKYYFDLPDSTYKTSVFTSNEKTDFKQQLNYEVIDVRPSLQRQCLDYIVRRFNNYYFVVADKNYRVIADEEIPIKSMESKLFLTDSGVDIIYFGEKKDRLYRYTF